MFFNINTRSGKVLHPLPVRWEFPSPGWVKINIDGTTRGSPGLVACGGIFRGSMGYFIGGFSISFIFRLFWLLNFMELYMSLKKLKRWVLLVYDLNVILPWFVLHLLLGLTFLGFFVIGGTLALITVEKLGLRFLTYFMKVMHVLTNLLI